MMLRTACFGALLGSVLLLNAANAAAHDYWLTVDKDAQLPVVRMWLGQKMEVQEEKPYAHKRTVGFFHYTTRGRTKLAPQDGARPLVSQALAAGGHMFALERNAAYIELAPEKFNNYLKHEGLDAVVKERERLGEQDKPGRERYTRYLKAHAQIGDVRDEIYATKVGHAFELVLRGDPARQQGEARPQGDPARQQGEAQQQGDPARQDGEAARQGQERWEAALMFRGKPLAQVPVHIYRLTDGSVETQQRLTDEAGLVDLGTRKRGDYLVRAVHMIRCEGCEKTDWHSFWTAHSFSIGKAGMAAPKTGSSGTASPTSSAATSPSASPSSAAQPASTSGAAKSATPGAEPNEPGEASSGCGGSCSAASGKTTARWAMLWMALCLAAMGWRRGSRGPGAEALRDKS